ncbi:MAG: glycosyltransferase [Planctomycetes bacterium]|nr:glycosyltransferase [Planctomycetota bacterium]
MKILHLFANWKWTGPAEPALATAWCQSSEHEVLFASGSADGGQPSKILPHARELGVPTVEGFHLGKHARFRKNREDAARLATLLRDFAPEIVHTHLDNDHRIASIAVRETGVGRLVRTVYDTSGLSGSLRMRRVARRALAGLVVTTRAGFEGTLATYGGSARSISVAGTPRPMVLVETGVDPLRFDRTRFDRDAQRRKLGLQPHEVAIGIVARVQPHRRFDLLIDAFEPVARAHPELKLVVVGRGTRIEELLLAPVAARGLSDRVLSTGYLSGDDYPGALCALDASLFLVPGSDGTCRALREQMSIGLPPLVTPRTPLPEIVEEGTAGIVVEESVEALRRGLLRLVAEPGLRERLGRGAAEAARRRFDVRTQSGLVTAFYERVLSDDRAATV